MTNNTFRQQWNATVDGKKFPPESFDPEPRLNVTVPNSGGQVVTLRSEADIQQLWATLQGRGRVSETNSSVEIIDRPTRPVRGLRNKTGEIAAIIETATTGKAVRIAINGRSREAISGNLRTRVMSAGVDPRGRLHTMFDGDYVIAWLDPA